MKRIKDIFKTSDLSPRYLLIKNDILLLYLKGIRGIFEKKKQFPYNFFNTLLLFGSTIYAYKWFTYQLKNEYERHDRPNILIPNFIYKCRREHYIYWELSRLARGKATTFSYFDWDPNTESIYFTERDGTLKFEKFSVNRERMDILENPLFEQIFRKYDKDRNIIEKGNKLIAYHKNAKKRYDLDNYLHYKPITIFDCFRAVYYQIMIGLGLSNKYRYDHVISKPDYFYDFEKLRIALNLTKHDQTKNSSNYLSLFSYLNNALIQFSKS